MVVQIKLHVFVVQCPWLYIFTRNMAVLKLLLSQTKKLEQLSLEFTLLEKLDLHKFTWCKYHVQKSAN